MKPIVVRHWVSVASKFDGASLHATDSHRLAFEDEYFTRFANLESRVHSYSSGPSDAAPFVVLVDDALYERIRASKNGVRIFKRQYQQLIKPLKRRLRIL